MQVEIIVVTHGWVVVGVVQDDGRESGEAEIAHAHAIARWGTSRGIAQLCESGPLQSTRLESMVPHADRLRINRAHIVARLLCDSSKWLRALGVS